MAEELKVFRLNDHDWVVAKSFDRAVDYYMKKTGFSFEDAVDPSCDPHECSTDMTVNVDMDDVMNYLNEDEVASVGFNTSIECYQVPAHYLIKKDYKGEPFILCSIEH